MNQEPKVAVVVAAVHAAVDEEPAWAFDAPFLDRDQTDISLQSEDSSFEPCLSRTKKRKC